MLAPSTVSSMASERRTSGWTEYRIREELEAFLRGRAVWPSYREFQRAGLKSLRDQVTHQGGAEQWAEEMGVRYVRHRPGYAPIWTEERIREELTDYLAGREVWPSRLEFERDGHTLLRSAVNRTGGPDRWAPEFGLTRATRLSGVRRGWTPELVEAELRKLIGDGTAWPSVREFRRAGLYSMLTSIYQHEGPEYWAARMGVAKRAGFRRPRRPVWTRRRIRDELRRFCAGRDWFPTEREFVDAGLSTLYRAASRNGGIPYWAGRLKLPRGRRRPA
jgi:hypothetical protein